MQQTIAFEFSKQKEPPSEESQREGFSSSESGGFGVSLRGALRQRPSSPSRPSFRKRQRVTSDIGGVLGFEDHPPMADLVVLGLYIERSEMPVDEIDYRNT